MAVQYRICGTLRNVHVRFNLHGRVRHSTARVFRLLLIWVKEVVAKFRVGYYYVHNNFDPFEDRTGSNKLRLHV